MRVSGMPAVVSAVGGGVEHRRLGAASTTFQVGWGWESHEAAACARPCSSSTASTRSTLVDGLDPMHDPVDSGQVGELDLGVDAAALQMVGDRPGWARYAYGLAWSPPAVELAWARQW